jgi:hypothetical protein
MVKISRYSGLLVGLFGCVLNLSAQRDRGQGFELGIFQVMPEAEVLGAFDKEQGSEGDYYGEAAVGVDFENSEARYDIGGGASYGYRAYESNSDINDDFYDFSGEIASQKSPLKLSLWGQYKKTVDYDTTVNDGDGSDLGAILTRSTSERSSVRFATAYEKSVAGNSSLLPSYEAWYYNQTFEGAPDAEWQDHAVRLQYGYNLESLVVLTLSGSYSAQFSDLEDGTVVNISIGAQSRNREKVSWSARIGVSAVDYDISGTDEGVEADLSLRWQASEKISAYLFAETSYQLGYAAYGGGSARQVYRAGYGGAWAMLERLRLNVQFLHDRQQSIQAEPTLDRFFTTAGIEYDVLRMATLALGFLDPNRILGMHPASKKHKFYVGGAGLFVIGSASSGYRVINRVINRIAGILCLAKHFLTQLYAWQPAAQSRWR